MVPARTLKGGQEKVLNTGRLTAEVIKSIRGAVRYQNGRCPVHRQRRIRPGLGSGPRTKNGLYFESDMFVHGERLARWFGAQDS